MVDDGGGSRLPGHVALAQIAAGRVARCARAAAVATAFSGRARVAQLALVDGLPGAVWAPGGQPRGAFAFTLEDERIVGIEILADPDHLRQLELTILTD